MDVRGFGRSETGDVRSINQDRYWVGDEPGVFVVADGLGGKSHGERASAALVEGVAERAEELHRLLGEGNPATDRRHRVRVHDFLTRLVGGINTEIYEAGNGEMGTTCELLAVAGGAGFVAHVGDSRTYLLRDGGAYQLTEDHTFAEKMRSQKRAIGADPSEIDEEYEHVLTRSIGGDPRADIDTLFVDVQPGDRFLLCTDGVSNVIEESELRRSVESVRAEKLADRVVEGALEAGTTDNATAVVVAAGAESEPFVGDTPVDTVRKVTFLEQVDLFEGLQRRELLRILRIVYRQRFQDGETIIRRSEEADQMFMLLEGEVSLQIEGHEITRLTPGAHFGEMALFGAGTRSADAIAVGEVVLLAVPSDQFRRLVEYEDVHLGNKLLRNLIEHATARIRETTMELMEARNGGAETAELLEQARTLEMEGVSEGGGSGGD